MSPIDYVPPVPAAVVETPAPDAAAEELEWVRIEARHERADDGLFYPISASVRVASSDDDPAVLEKWGWFKNCGMGQTKQHPRAYKFTPYPIAPKRPKAFDISATNLPHKRCAYRDLPVVGIRDIALKGQLNWLYPTPESR